ncbi:hypothetical protein HRR83_009313 [Exophiala dermatitidis]|uniref:MFS transporter, DHA1 family, multidrug resistance protein n=2 Tax=Exophiala dermatitidis TaxID=5970 RepID=H6C9G8_EXODN|nr:MFS transporter, DHA1 family, multidrug resistance protein [Exophiala dermatitidis NIH/UT8656]KAJ4502016.1 hypothetical protein HRR75_008702 [Exophiala dermatitidis]EHY59877.1 MFS transporter, DHA1 family, multidrug resistance protein [Exophiala dermatitidis NIH/UT8656]KAJ4502397.1 hypothetical protein HRR73_009468 [Exophiala dermatitidis]KAJ4502918.1 hypothetical protein HRR74_009458 [Exophiala dermatitidis]KAJ4530379.1 hypothetical protein HRR76_008097 [Exophiala dermatitidis]
MADNQMNEREKEELSLEAQGHHALGLTPISSRRSQAAPTVRSSRSYVDGHSTYISERDEEDADIDAQIVDVEGSSAKAFEVGWDGPDDPMNPKNMSKGRKWLIVITLAFGSLCVTCTSSLYTTTYGKMDAEFGNSRIVATLGLSLFVFGLGLSPMILGPLSEFYGRRPIYILAYVFFTIWLIPCATSQNIQTMLIARFLDGFSGSAFLSVAGGTVGDMFNRDQLQAPMMVYTASPFIGPGVGPIIGGFINYNTSWRWSYYVLLIWSGVMLVSITLFVPETYMPVLLRTKARRKRKETGDERWKAPIEIMERSIFWTVVRSLYRPFMLLFMEPMCFNLCLLSSILLGILYLFFGAFNLVFSTVYGFNLWQVGLSFLGLTIGMLLAIASDPIWHRNYLRLLRTREEATGERKSEPEFRLPPSIVGPWFCVVGLFWFAWTIYARIHWIVPIIATSFFGFGTILTFSGVFTFLVEAYPLYAASALSANSFARSSFAGAFPLFGLQMYKTLNYHWATTLLAFLCLAMAPFPYLFFIYGKRLRQKSRFTHMP